MYLAVEEAVANKLLNLYFKKLNLVKKNTE